MAEKAAPIRVMVVDDEPGILFSVEQMLDTCQVETYQDPLVALANLSSREYDVLIVDYKMPECNGIDFFLKAKVLSESSYKILLTAFAEKEILQESINSSLINRVVEKPFRRKVLQEAVDAGCRCRDQRRQEYLLLQAGYRELRREKVFYDREVIGVNGGLKETVSRLEKAAQQPVNVLFSGEGGTGKGLLAHLLHTMSTGEGAPFYSLDCMGAGVEEALFGGAGAEGMLGLADGGTLLLRRIEALPLRLQERLLSALKEKELIRLGGTPSDRTGFRLAATTGVDISRVVESGGFREDLYYAVNAFPVTVPPLRERRQDVPELIVYFAELFAREQGTEPPAVPETLFSALQEHPWRGNVRELEQAVRQAVLHPDGECELKPGHFRAGGGMVQDGALAAALADLAGALSGGRITYGRLEAELARAVLEKLGGDRAAARRTGIPESLL